MNKNNKLIESIDIARHYLHQEQTLKYEQLSHLLNQHHKIISKDLSNSYKILQDTLQSIRQFLEENKLDFSSSKNSKGSFTEFSYKTFALLNAQMSKEMNIIYLSNSQEFDQYSVKLYEDCIKPLPQHLIQDYLIWESKK